VKYVNLKKIEKPCLLQVLYVLTNRPGIIFTELKDAIEGSDHTVKKAVDYLIEIGLLKEEREKEFPRRRRLYPTEKGKRIGELLEKIDEILGE